MKVIDVAPGIRILDASDAGLRILCGCPENSVKFLMRAGIIQATEKNGVRFDTGPNAVLLTEAPLRNGRFRNAAEFPVLHMLYRQGMIVPGHPNNTGARPLIIGTPRCVDELSEYIYLGNHGLTERSDIVGGGIDEAAADEILRIKKLFSFGAFRKTEELMELKRIDAPIVKLRGGLFLRREGPDRYEFILDGESVKIDLRTFSEESAGAPYVLPRVSVPNQSFAVTNIGEGDGWDPTRPCMSSLVVAGNERWLVDAGPNIDYTLEALGLSIADISGVFNTHVHDDHFLGLASLFRGERKIAYCAVPCVRRAAERKLAALARIDEEEFSMYFDVRDLVADEWNRFAGFDVMPIVAPHPVENTLFRFRATGKEGGRTYAHWADLTSFAILDSMSASKLGTNGLQEEAVARFKQRYLEPADLKKLDVGGGMIHGVAQDFADDRSGEILLSHTSVPVPDPPFARTARFGETIVLIAGTETPALAAGPGSAAAASSAPNLESPFFQGVAIAARILSEASEIAFSEGTTIPEGSVYAVASGTVSLLATGKIVDTIGAGGVFGLESLLPTDQRIFTNKAASRVTALRIPPEAIIRVPALLWRARGLFTERLIAAESGLPFEWRAEYDMAVPEVDDGHRRLFSCIERLNEKASPEEEKLCRESLRETMVEHFTAEEALMESAGYPWLREHRRLHEKLLAEFTETRLDSPASDIVGEFKDCFIRHTLIADRRYLPWLEKKA